MATANVPELSCALCGHRETATMFTLARWARIDEGPAGTAAVCPGCVSEHEDWQRRVREAPRPAVADASPEPTRRRRRWFLLRRAAP